MQDLRIVLIVVGVLAIAALLIHGLWTSKKEGKAKFADKPLSKLDMDEETVPVSAVKANSATDNTTSPRTEPDFGAASSLGDDEFDPLLEPVSPFSHKTESQVDVEVNEQVMETSTQEEPVQDTPAAVTQSEVDIDANVESKSADVEADAPTKNNVKQKVSQPEMEVIVLHVHASGDGEFVGTQLFDSMQQNGLVYGDMDIFHRHIDQAGTGKVLFSVANMLNPGTLAHEDPATFTTKGISFFMTLPCFGEAEQNFKLMLRTAQQIADDLGATVLDDKRNMMTPNRLSAYRQQIRDFVQRSRQAN